MNKRGREREERRVGVGWGGHRSFKSSSDPAADWILRGDGCRLAVFRWPCQLVSFCYT